MRHNPFNARKGEQAPPRWNRLSDYFLHRLGERVQKVPLDAGFSCPNRDGSLSSSGCLFCNPIGSGTGLGLGGLSLAEQWEERRRPSLNKGLRLFLAYLQSFSNTYGPLEYLASVLEQLKSLPGIAGIAVGTRPDCVDAAKLALIARCCEEQGWHERWIEFGVQSSKNASLERIRRGHDIACAERAIHESVRSGLQVCVHLIAGLPGESAEDFLNSVRWASSMPVQGIKFHCLYVCEGSLLADEYRRRVYQPWSQEEYVSALAGALPYLRQDIVVQRITGEPGEGELIAPEWAPRSRETEHKLRLALEAAGSWQGCRDGSFSV